MSAVNGYAARPSVRAGEVVRLHIATAAPRIHVDFYRWGAAPQHAGHVEWPGRAAATGRFDADWRWPAYEFRVPPQWRSGVYIAVLSTEAAHGIPPLDAREARILLVVTPSAPSGHGILYKIPTFTYQAYNTAGGGSLYSAAQVTTRRPGGGVGGPVKGLPDAYDLSSPRQTFAHWDALFIAWMERNGIEADYCTDLDLHEGLLLHDGYRLLVSAGHDEYWSPELRRHVTTFRDSGGHLANFGANTCWWRVRVTPDGTGLFCDKFPPGATGGTDPDSSYGCPDHWWESEPENTLLGVSYRNGGGHWDGTRTRQGFIVTDADHWVYSGTGLQAGDSLGRDGALIGYECDGAAFTYDHSGRPRPTGEDGTPENFEILGIAELPPDWNFPAREPRATPRAATLGVFTAGGTVFTAATTDWARLLATDPQVAAVTRNVLARLS
ncbi:N,N-dimethylformamidase beta subunit family domain-containing protein [Streptomyces fradiae]|uniref:N,N-dimethylformamidase beta subunit family domain-containing protein n=1 Tax=Streptomyces fradiae TaxID=1906 RepID=UPI003986F549